MSINIKETIRHRCPVGTRKLFSGYIYDSYRQSSYKWQRDRQIIRFCPACGEDLEEEYQKAIKCII